MTATMHGPYTVYLRMLNFQWYKKGEQPTLPLCWDMAANENRIDEVTGVILIDRDGQLRTWFGPAMRNQLLQTALRSE